MYRLTMLLVAILALASPLVAADRYYVGPHNGSWNDPANWSATPGGPGGAGVPVPGDLAYITGNTPVTVNFDTSYATQLRKLSVDGAGVQRTVRQTDPSSALFSGDQNIGIDGIGRYEQSAGSNTITHYGAETDQYLGLGLNAGSNGTYVMSGGTLSITSFRFNGGLLVGLNGQGTFDLSAGNVTVNNNIGVGGGNVGTVNQTGGTMTVGSNYDVFLGRATNGNGFYNLDDTAGPASLLVSGGNLWVGYQGTGTFVQDGGDVTVTSTSGNAGYVSIAGPVEGVGHYTITDGTLTTKQVRVGGDANAGGTGTLTVSGGTVNAGLAVWTPASVVTIDGGTINSCGTPPCGPDPADNVLNNGTINIDNGGTLNFGGRMYGTGITIVGGGTNLSSPSGAPTLNLADQSNLQTGTVRVAGGTAASPGKLLVGKTTVDGAGSATLDIRGGDTTIDGVLGIANDGTLSFAATSTLAPEVVRGQLLMSGGTLSAGGILLGNTSGDAGEMTVNGGQIICGSLGMHDVTMSNGSITVTNQTPPPGQDPMLNGSIVGGYLRSGAMHVHGGTVTAPRMKLGVTSGQTGSFDMDGGTMNVGILGVGNDATLTSGTGTGTVSISAGTINADTVMLGSSAGGDGTMTISGTGQVIVGGGLTYNALNVNGGTLTVLDQAPPAGEDPVLDRSIVGGYLRSGAMTMNSGTVTTPNLKVGITHTGTFTMNGGTLTAASLLAASGAGSVIAFNGGTLHVGQSNVDGATALTVGNGTAAARLNLSPAGGTHTFADGLSIAANAQLTGGGTINGNVISSGQIAPGNSVGKISVDGDLALSSSRSTLAMELGGAAPGSYDELAVDGSVTLAGVLRVTLISGFVPSNGQTFAIVTGSTMSGQFGMVTAPAVAGIAFRVRYAANEILLDALTDSDGDSVGDVDDNCPSVANRTQSDFDSDTEGDLCDLDDGLDWFLAFAGAGIDWQAETATSYNLYRSSRARLIATGEYTQDPLVEPQAAHFCSQLGTHLNDALNPPSGQVNLYLVTHILGGVESSLGNRSGEIPRPNAHPCP